MTAAGLGWLSTWLLAPVGRGLAWLARGTATVLAVTGAALYTGAVWLVRCLLVVPAVALLTHVLAPVGRGLLWLGWTLVTGAGLALYWMARILFVLPALALWRWVLTPLGRALAFLGRETAAALGHAWRIAGYVSTAVGRFFLAVLRVLFVEPARWAYRTVLTPLGHFVRDVVWRPAAAAARGAGRATRQAPAAVRDSARQARADLRHLLLGAPKEPLPPSRREPRRRGARTLDKRSGPEVSPPARR